MASATSNADLAAWKRTGLSRIVDSGFVWLTGFFGIGVAVVLLSIAYGVGIQAIPSIQKFGLGFLFTSQWDPVQNLYGAWPQVYGTIITSLIALAIAVPIGVGIALFLSEDFLPPKIQRPIVFLIELLAAIPGVVYGLWGV
ncbi:MAG: phosphate ABC transporter permease subunit PstC, partial [Kovacikia sp.]